MSTPIQKAGGILTRDNNGTTEIYVIHRPRYDDWSVPKGHIDDGESPKDAALREVAEETGLQCSVTRELPPYEYQLPSGQRSTVYFFEMSVVSFGATKDDESDEGRWVTITQLKDLLSYDTLIHYISDQYGAR